MNSGFLFLFSLTMKNYKTIEELLATKKARKIIEEQLSSCHDEEVVEAVLEVNYSSYKGYTFDDLENAISDIERWKITYYSDLDSYHDSCDELIDFRWSDEILQRYFDYDSYHDDCDYDITEASNWIVIANW